VDNLLSKDDVAEIVKASNQGENCLCSSQWLMDLANKITNTLDKLHNLQSSQKCETTDSLLVKERTKWSGQLMYKHRGFSIPRYEDLGFFFTDSRDEALTLAQSRAQNWIENTFKEKEIEYWDVRVKPYVN
jgi:hypothetical protein